MKSVSLFKNALRAAVMFAPLVPSVLQTGVALAGEERNQTASQGFLLHVNQVTLLQDRQIFENEIELNVGVRIGDFNSAAIYQQVGGEKEVRSGNSMELDGALFVPAREAVANGLPICFQLWDGGTVRGDIGTSCRYLQPKGIDETIPLTDPRGAFGSVNVRLETIFVAPIGSVDHGGDSKIFIVKIDEIRVPSSEESPIQWHIFAAEPEPRNLVSNGDVSAKGERTMIPPSDSSFKADDFAVFDRESQKSLRLNFMTRKWQPGAAVDVPGYYYWALKSGQRIDVDQLLEKGSLVVRDSSGFGAHLSAYAVSSSEQ